MKDKTTNGQNYLTAFTDHFVLDAIIVGAGQAGLSASYFLKKYNLKHFVFERGKAGKTWRSQRWNSFRLNSTNKFNLLPGMKLESADEFPFHTQMLRDYIFLVCPGCAPVNQLPYMALQKILHLSRIAFI